MSISDGCPAPGRGDAGIRVRGFALALSLAWLVAWPAAAEDDAAPTAESPPAVAESAPADQPAETPAKPPAEDPGEPAGERTEAGGPGSPASLGLIQVVPAVWYERDLRFAYIGRTSFYSCSSLKAKVSQILKQMGAKPGFTVSVGSCYEGSRATQPMPSVRIHAAFPTEATPEVLAELEKTAPERELIRRAQGLPTDFDPALDTFAAVRTTVLFKDGRLGPIDPGDCELIQTMRDEVFKPAGMKILEDHIRCLPGEVTMGSIFMKVGILEQPRPMEAPREAEKGGKSDERKVKVETDTPIPLP